MDIGITLIIGYAAAVLFFFARGMKPRSRGVVLILLGPITLSSAILLRARIEAIRITVALALVIFLLHMWDLHLDAHRATRLSLKAYLVFLCDYAWSVARTMDGYGAGLPLGQRARDAVKHVTILCLASAAVVGVFKIGWARYPFLLEHSVKSTCLAAWTLGAFNANTALWRLAGMPAAYFTKRSVLGAHSPAEFWRRWNQPMHRWFLENVYRPLSRSGLSYMALPAPFAISGFLHEYLFAVTFHRVTGCVVAFFLLHGIAAMLTRRLKPRTRLVIPAIIATFAFNTFSTMLLLIPINERLPFYVNDVPQWMYLW